eukprot:TRINITY_DN63295_c0_g1_i1.p1 TRINITY_DN63295_c0_g1~~TRINITY_DN63295_c0_g1_i1.p1  ORF type:complete len:100 (+),score=7.48 TRINITY_DN63295_c0_g1_i1:28-327(+)
MFRLTGRALIRRFGINEPSLFDNVITRPGREVWIRPGPWSHVKHYFLRSVYLHTGPVLAAFGWYKYYWAIMDFDESYFSLPSNAPSAPEDWAGDSSSSE